MLRVHFTPDDLARVRVTPAPDALWETVLSATLLPIRRSPVVFQRWRARAHIQLRQLPPWQLRLVRQVAPPVGDFPDFLTPPETTAGGLEAGIEAMMTTPRSRLRREVAMLPGSPDWARPLAEGDPAALAKLGEALRGYHHAAIAPYWSRIHALVDADRAVRARAFLDAGAEGLLASLRPTLRWRAPVLEANYPVRHDIHLRGRGLVLVPSAFCWQDPITLADPRLPPVLVYPAAGQAPGWLASHRPSVQRSLANLLGGTRAAVLHVIESDGCTTTELARRVGISPPSASRHATALREAGLIVSIRQRNTMLHTITPLGGALIREGAKAI